MINYNKIIMADIISEYKAYLYKLDPIIIKLKQISLPTIDVTTC